MVQLICKLGNISVDALFTTTLETYLCSNLCCESYLLFMSSINYYDDLEFCNPGSGTSGF